MPAFEYTLFWFHQVSKFRGLAAHPYRRPLIAPFGDSTRPNGRIRSLNRRLNVLAQSFEYRFVDLHSEFIDLA